MLCYLINTPKLTYSFCYNTIIKIKFIIKFTLKITGKIMLKILYFKTRSNYFYIFRKKIKKTLKLQ